MKFDFQVLLQMTVTINTATQDEIDMNPLAGFANPVREVVKKRIFYGQADRKGGGGGQCRTYGAANYSAGPN